MDKKSKRYLIIALVVLLILAAISFYFYKQGKKTVTIQSLPGELPGNPGSGNQGGASNDELKLLVEALYKDMKGFNLGGHDYTPYNQANGLDDRDLVKLYNAFNTLYQKDSGQTLTEWMNNESYYYQTSPGLLLQRFAKLNLK